jgi:hypothetical protein
LGETGAGWATGGETIACWATGGETVAVWGRGGASVGSPKIGPLGGAAPADKSAGASGREARGADPITLGVVLSAEGLTGGCKTERGELVEASGAGVMSAGCRGEGPDDAGAGVATLTGLAEAPNAESRKESSRS